MEKTLYKESHKMSNILLFAMIIIMLAIPVWLSIREAVLNNPHGDESIPLPVHILLWLIPIATGAYISSLRLHLKISSSGLHYQLKPFMRKPKLIYFKDTQSVQIVKLQSFRKYGGRGIKRSINYQQYLLQGTHGLEIKTLKGKTYIFSITKPTELQYTLDKILRKEELS